MNRIKQFSHRLRQEFKGYNGKKFSKDLLAGVTVAAVALPLALAFGVSSGASAAAGMVTAVLAGFVIGAFTGGSYQISGPTGAMTAILVSLVAQYKLEGVFIACFLSGIILLIAGIFRMGALVSFIPVPVITGFTSGIAIIIALGQVNNLTGLTSEGESTLARIGSYFTLEQTLNPAALILGLAVIVFMVLYPKKWGRFFPSSLVAIILATAGAVLLELPVASVGEIPKTLFLEERLTFSDFSAAKLRSLILPAISIAALGLIESLLCGASAGRMKNEKLNADQELMAQGLGNMLIPFFGGVPATAAIARTSVAIKSGGQTRLTGIIHSGVLLLSIFALGGIMSAIPLSALAGVLIMTAWRMNEWAVIQEIFRRKIKTAVFQFLITMAATVLFDLTIAIVIGILFSLVAFIVKISRVQISVSDIDPAKLKDKTMYTERHKRVSVVYISGPLYFGTANQLAERLGGFEEKDTVILSMRGVPLADISGAQALEELCCRLSERNVTVYFTCVQPNVREMFDRCGMTEHVGKDMFYWSTDQALCKIN